MSLLTRVLGGRQRNRRSGVQAPLPRWRRILRRHWRAITVIGMVVVIGLVLLITQLFGDGPPCGHGLTEGSSGTCVGLDLDSGAFGATDALADLEGKIANLDSAVTGDFATIVLLDNMTPDLRNDSLGLQTVRHGVEGAITAVWRANNQTVAHGTAPKIKLLLASFGGGAADWGTAVTQITQARSAQHIAAVVGIGQSLDTTRQAAKKLSDNGIVTVGSRVTADNMNQWPDGHLIENFFRVAPTNTDMAGAAVEYMAGQKYSRVLLVQDENQHDSYAQTLGTAFNAAYQARYGAAIPYTELFKSPDGPLNGQPRYMYMENQFAGMHADICQDKPDLVYFAGRGTDLAAFLTALSQGGACGLNVVDVLTGDDASTTIGDRLPEFRDMNVRVFYTGEATRDEWKDAPTTSDNFQNYAAFAQVFSGVNGFEPQELQDGAAIISHDAVLAAATAVRLDPVATTDPSTVGASFLRYACRQTIPGASGEIAFDQAGNPIDKAMPIMRIEPDGTAVQQSQGIAWADGKPFDPTNCH